MYLKSLKLRLIAVFTSVFIVSIVVLYVASYFLLSSSLRQEEQRFMNSQALQFWAVYQTGGLQAVRRELTLERALSETNRFFVRVASPLNTTLVFLDTTDWPDDQVERLVSGLRPSEGNVAGISSEEQTGDLYVVSIPLYDGNRLQIGVSTVRRVILMRRFRRTFLLVALPLVAVGIVAGWVFSARSLRPIKKLSNLMKNIIDTGRLSERIPSIRSRDELGELVGLVNRMLERIENLVIAMRHSLDNVAHDLRTPLTRLRMNAEMAMQSAERASAGSADEDDDGGDDKDQPGSGRMHRDEPARADSGRVEALRALELCVEESERMLAMLNTLMDISEAETGVMRLNLTRVDLGEIVADIAELYSYTAEDKGIYIVTEIPEGLSADVDVDRFRQVAANLIDNAVKYSETGGIVTIRGKSADSNIVIEVEDQGIGIEEKDLPYIWDRLYRADSSRSAPGLGLGLGLVKAVVEAHRGKVSVESTPGEGTTFRIGIPAG